jgi:transposase
MGRIIRRKFTAEFRAEAIRMVLEQGLGIAETARRLEMSDKSLGNWVRLAQRRSAGLPSGAAAGMKSASGAARSVTELEAEVSRLRAENARLKTEREILKKATAFFAKESP